MNLQASVIALVGIAGYATIEQTVNPSTVYALKDITVSSLLGLAVVYLYKELGKLSRERKDEKVAITEFIDRTFTRQEQMMEAHAKMLHELTGSVKDLRQVNDEQLSLHKSTIARLVDLAINERAAARRARQDASNAD